MYLWLLQPIVVVIKIVNIGSNAHTIRHTNKHTVSPSLVTEMSAPKIALKSTLKS